jgi:hypothetical protein
LVKRIFNIDGSPDTYTYNSIINSLGEGITGNIYEMLIYTKVIDDTKRMLIEGYLADKWSLKTKLNADHPLFPTFSPVATIKNLNIKNINGLTLWLDASDKKTLLDKNLNSVLDTFIINLEESLELKGNFSEREKEEFISLLAEVMEIAVGYEDLIAPAIKDKITNIKHLLSKTDIVHDSEEHLLNTQPLSDTQEN